MQILNIIHWLNKQLCQEMTDTPRAQDRYLKVQ